MDTHGQVRPAPQGSVVILVACVIGYGLSFADLPSSLMLRNVSIVLLVGILISFLLDIRLGIRNLIRVDVFALLALYFLTYFEFLFPQERFDYLSMPSDVVTACHLTLLGLGVMVIGRHLEMYPKNVLGFITQVEMKKGDYLLIYFGAFFLAHLPMWLAVDFNMVQWFDELLSPRFGRSWGRGRYGNLSSLLHELQLLGYVMPPIAGVIFARRHEYKKFTLFLVSSALIILWFVAFTSGTRNILAIQLAGFLGGFFIVQHELKLRTMAIVGATTAISFFILAGHMLDFRQMGLREYIEGGYYTSEYKEYEDDYLSDPNRGLPDQGYFVDYNMWRIAQLVAVFPDVYNYAGWNLPFVAVTKPIPRALWKGKPKDLEVGLEEAIGAEGYTIACTWIGEAYITGGSIWIVGIGLLIGSFCRFWNQLASGLHSPFPLIVFASGFYATLLLMRSLMFFTTALLPSIALVVMGVFLYKNRNPA